MPRRVTVNLAALSILLIVSANFATAAEPAAPVKWHTDLSQAVKVITKQKRPMLLFVTMSGCTYCVRMKQQTYSNAEVQSRIRDSYVALQIDGQKHQEIARRLGVRVYPTTAIVSPQGKVVSVIHGYASSDDLLKQLLPVDPEMPARIAQTQPVNTNN